jgi:hypothetical protein
MDERRRERRSCCMDTLDFPFSASDLWAPIDAHTQLTYYHQSPLPICHLIACEDMQPNAQRPYVSKPPQWLTPANSFRKSSGHGRPMEQRTKGLEHNPPSSPPTRHPLSGGRLFLSQYPRRKNPDRSAPRNKIDRPTYSALLSALWEWEGRRRERNYGSDHRVPG